MIEKNLLILKRKQTAKKPFMKKKLEDKILEEIRNKVIEKDLDRKNEKEISEMRDANIEALTELTSLSRKEVEKIADDVKRDFLFNQKKKQKRLNGIIALCVISAIILFFIFKPKPELKIRLVEDDFSENNNEWYLFNSYNYRRYINENKYIIETNKKDWCYWDNVQIDFPKNYDVEVKSTWLNGKYDSYGIALHKSNTDYYAFTIRGDGGVSFCKVVEKNWIIDDGWKPDMAKKGKKQSNTQKIEVRGGEFKYFVNNNLIRSGIIEMEIGNLALRCCGEQQIGFEYVKIINTDTKKVVFEDDFTSPSDNWDQDKDFLFETGFASGKFTINSNYNNECNWSTSAKLLITDNSEIELSSLWLSGELANYGLMILNDDENYYSYEFQNNGEARLVERRNGEYVYVQPNVKTKFESDGNKTFTQKVVIKDGKINYFINNQLIKESNAELVFPLKIALRLCGKQSVAFDKLIIRYFE